MIRILTPVLFFVVGCASTPHAASTSSPPPAERSLADDGSIFRIPVDLSKVIMQGEMECGPASIFNAFAIGNPVLQFRLNELEGATQEEKYATLIQKVAERPSEQFGGMRPRTNAGGTWIGDMRFIIQDILTTSQGIKGRYLLRPDNIYGPGEFVEKIRQQFEHSLQLGVPVVFSISSYIHHRRIYGHYMTLVGVSRATKDGQFTIEFVNPMFNEPQITTGTIYESSSPFRAYTWEIYSQPGQEVFGRMRDDEGGMESPFLLFSAPGFSLGGMRSERLILEQGFGRIPSDVY